MLFRPFPVSAPPLFPFTPQPLLPPLSPFPPSLPPSPSPPLPLPLSPSLPPSLSLLAACDQPWITMRPRQWHALDEIHAGIFDGMTYAEVEAADPEEFKLRKMNKLSYRYPRGESYVDVIQRLDTIIHELERQRDPVSMPIYTVHSNGHIHVFIRLSTPNSSGNVSVFLSGCLSVSLSLCVCVTVYVVVDAVRVGVANVLLTCC
jgi:hypothetical protein